MPGQLLRMEVTEAKQLVMRVAGPYVDVIVYPSLPGREDKRKRSAARDCSSDLRQRLNDRTAAQKFRRLIAVNFSPRDWVATLTYSDDALPATPELAVKKRLKPFIGQLRGDFRDGGEILKYMYVTEGLHGDKRLHHHIILPDCLDVRETVRELWSKYGYVGFERISSRGYMAWASYLSKEPRKTGRRYVGSRMWTPSLGLKKPEEIRREVDDDYVFDPPAGVEIDRQDTLDTDWFRAQYVSYYDPAYWSQN